MTERNIRLIVADRRPFVPTAKLMASTARTDRIRQMIVLASGNETNTFVSVLIS